MIGAPLQSRSSGNHLFPTSSTGFSCARPYPHEGSRTCIFQRMLWKLQGVANHLGDAHILFQPCNRGTTSLYTGFWYVPSSALEKFALKQKRCAMRVQSLNQHHYVTGAIQFFIMSKIDGCPKILSLNGVCHPSEWWGFQGPGRELILETVNSLPTCMADYVFPWKPTEAYCECSQVQP